MTGPWSLPTVGQYDGQALGDDRVKQVRPEGQLLQRQGAVPIRNRSIPTQPGRTVERHQAEMSYPLQVVCLHEHRARAGQERRNRGCRNDRKDI